VPAAIASSLFQYHHAANGNVLHGPATKHLQTLRVKLTDEDNLKLFTA